MFKKKIYIFLTVMLMYGCGFTPIHKNTLNNNLAIKIISKDGDFEINNIIISRLKPFDKKNYDKIFEITISTNYEKKITSRNLAGKPDSYELQVKTSVEIINNEENNNFIIEENNKMNNLVDTSTDLQFEKSIKTNFANSIFEKIIQNLNNQI